MGIYYAPKTIESLAYNILVRYQQKTGRLLTPPISAESILDVVFDKELRSLLWEPIPEPPGRTILAGLNPEDRLIVLNETRRQIIMETDGLFNSLVAHELGHWTLHVDPAALLQSQIGDMPFIPQFRCDRGEPSSWDEKNAHRFMAYLLLPEDLLIPQATTADLTNWRGVYELRTQFNVTITTMKIRLEELGLVYIDEQGVFFKNRQEAHGQQRLF